MSRRLTYILTWPNAALCLLIIVLAAMLQGCAKPRFSMHFDIKGNAPASCRMAYYANSKKKGFTVEDALFLNKGKAEVQGATARPTLVYIFTDTDIPKLIFYAERGDDINISGEGSESDAWSVDGNDINEEWTRWRKANLKILRSDDAKKINAAVAAFVNSNRKNPLSAILLATTYRRADDDAGFRRLWMSLDSKLHTDKYLDLLAQADLQAEYSDPTIDETPLRTAANGLDTLQPRNAPTIIYFWNASHPGRKAGIDTLRSLALEYPDSMKRNIVDICLDADSISWRMPLETDSLRHTLRAWMPLGWADPWIMRVQPLATPSFIVADKRLNQTYRGSDPAAASAAFRRLLR